MSNAPAINTSPMDIDSSSFTISPTGIAFHAELSVEEWKALGTRLGSAGRSLGFMIGDWLNYGEGKGEWGNTYDEAMRITGLDLKTLRDYSSVSRKVKLSLRNEKLSFEHHKKVAPLKDEKEQAKWLKLAEKERSKQDGKPMSARRLAKSILVGRVVSPEQMQADPADKGRDNVHPHVNRLVVFWGKMKRKGWLEDSEDLQLQRLMRDLEPVVKIYDEIADALEARKTSVNPRVDTAA